MIEDIVNVQISRTSATVTRAGFGVPAIMSKVGNVTFAEKIRFYSDFAGAQTDFDAALIGTEELDAANRMFLPDIKPSKIAIIKRATPVAQVNLVTVVSAVNDTLYRITINGVNFDFTSDSSATQMEIADGLISAITAGDEPVTPLNVADDVQLTADVAGEGFTVTVNDAALLSNAVTTPNVGASSDLQAASDENDDFYGLMMISNSEGDVMDLAFKVETLRKLFTTRTLDPDVLSNTTPNIASRLFDKKFARTAWMFSNDVASFPDAAWLGRILPREVGSTTWANKTLRGITVDNLTTTQKANIQAKNGNYYIEAGGRDLTQRGQVAEGEFIDVIRGVDWIQARMTEEVFLVIVSNEKVPYTDAGISLIENPMTQVLQQAEDRGILASPDGELPAFVVLMPKALEISSSQKATRILNDVNFTGKLAGAIHATDIVGNVSV